MNDLFKIIDNRALKQIDNVPLVKSIPCSVVEVLENNMVKVKLLSEDIEYTIPNLCGSPVTINEVVYLYYKGNVISDRSAYIGAAKFKPSTNFVMGNGAIGALSTEERAIANVSFLTYHSNASFVFNAVCENGSNETRTVRLTIYIDNELQSFKPRFSIVAEGSYTISVTLPLNLTLGNHNIVVKAIGNSVSVASIRTYVTGYVNEKIIHYEPTNEEDYIWGLNQTGADVYLFIGDSPSPEVLAQLDNNDVNTLSCTAFNYADIEAVYIPEGIERIE